MIVDEFAKYAQHEAGRALPGDVTHHAKRALIDWFSALFPGIGVAPGPQLMRAHARELGQRRASLPGQRTTAFPATAAWINGSISHSVEFDDIFRDAVYHPGCPTIAAALAVAEDRGSSGADLLKAITVGYEISTRIGVAIQPSHYRFFHTTGTVGCFGSAAATAALLDGGNADVMRHALATAASFAAGLQQAFRSDAMTKALHAGHAAWVGVTAGRGRGQRHHRGAGHSRRCGGLWRRDVGGAPMGVCDGWTGRALQHQVDHPEEPRLLRPHLRRHRRDAGHPAAAPDRPGQIESIRVDTYKTALDVTGNFEPRTAFEAKFSLPYVVSHALLYGAVRLNAFEPERLADAGLRALMARTQLNADPDLSAKFPGVRAARVTVTMRGGQVIEQFAPCRKGDPEAPLTDADLNDKFTELASPVIGAEAARQLLDQLWDIERHDVSTLRLTAL